MSRKLLNKVLNLAGVIEDRPFKLEDEKGFCVNTIYTRFGSFIYEDCNKSNQLMSEKNSNQLIMDIIRGVMKIRYLNECFPVNGQRFFIPFSSTEFIFEETNRSHVYLKNSGLCCKTLEDAKDIKFRLFTYCKKLQDSKESLFENSKYYKLALIFGFRLGDPIGVYFNTEKLYVIRINHDRIYVFDSKYNCFVELKDFDIIQRLFSGEYRAEAVNDAFMMLYSKIPFIETFLNELTDNKDLIKQALAYRFFTWSDEEKVKLEIELTNYLSVIKEKEVNNHE